jgi:hypothetical protein
VCLPPAVLSRGRQSPIRLLGRSLITHRPPGLVLRPEIRSVIEKSRWVTLTEQGWVDFRQRRSRGVAAQPAPPAQVRFLTRPAAAPNLLDLASPDDTRSDTPKQSRRHNARAPSGVRGGGRRPRFENEWTQWTTIQDPDAAHDRLAGADGSQASNASRQSRSRDLLENQTFTWLAAPRLREPRAVCRISGLRCRYSPARGMKPALSGCVPEGSNCAGSLAQPGGSAGGSGR